MIIGISCSENAIYTSAGDMFTELPLTNLIKYAGNQLISLDMDADISRILRFCNITIDDGIKLLKKEKLYIDGTDFKITWFRGRFAAIDLGHGALQNTVKIYNAQSFTDPVKHKADNSRDYHYIRAVQARNIGVEILKSYRNLRLPHDQLTTPISTFLKAMPLDIPLDIDTPAIAQDLAYSAVRHNWSEIYQIGHFPDAWDMDITLAYSSQLAELLDTRRGYWIEQIDEPAGAVYGFAHGTLTINPKIDFHPYLVNEVSNDDDDNDATTAYAPKSSYETVLTLNEIAFLHKWRIGKFKIDKAVWWIMPTNAIYQPLKGVVNWLQSKRQQSTGLQRDIVKRIQNSIWGRTGQVVYNRQARDYVPGQQTNFVYHSIVESNIRLKVADMIYSNHLQNDVLRIAVDGCIVSKQPEKLDIGDSMGEWKIKKGSALVVTGGAAVHSSRPNSNKDYALNYDDFYNYFKDNPDATYYHMQSTGVITLASAIKYGRFDQLGEYENRSRNIPIGRMRSKRIWPELPNNARDLLARQYFSYAAPYGVDFEIKGDRNNE